MGYNKKAYYEYEEKLYSLTRGTDCTPKAINELFAELLTVLPNNGKLYKYKALDTFHIDELEEKYVWFSSAKDLNDDKDCTFNANFLKDVKEIIKYLLTDDNYRKFLIKVFYNKYQFKGVTLEEIKDCLECVTKNGKAIGKLKFIEFCKKYRLSLSQSDELAGMIVRYSEENLDKEKLTQSIINTFLQIKELRNYQHVLSLTTSYKKDSMWAYYCKNKGICLEYDFSKINSEDLKRRFINTQKVRYGKKKRVSYADIFKLKFTDNKEEIIQADKLTLGQMLTKDKSWQTEDEWRVLLFNKGNEEGTRIPANIVSAIYIDYSILQEEKTKRIIDLAKTNGWQVFVRYFDNLNVEYRYETIEKTKQRITELKKEGFLR